ncbi:V-type ATP synthase subunit D [Candidatus Similichlamydia epinepheli]|uniref:V-type ATP synthase subunit D n=1 Tax=Candidatus Similichlamydia epinepheli TaxID=1903953 RepID=UPI000D3CC8EF|nr:V-type ATP synthase subunit D [Candidatus Similichlamydia epinepheli]
MTASITLKLTKGELRSQRKKLSEFQAYLPILVLKKGLLQKKVLVNRSSLAHFREEMEKSLKAISSQKASLSMNPKIGSLLSIEAIDRSLENVAGISLPYISSITWKDVPYSIAGTPYGTEQFIQLGRLYLESKIRFEYAERRLRILETEFKRISVRTNLIEKVLIPRRQDNIKKILVFLGDVELAAIGRSKISKKKKV